MRPRCADVPPVWMLLERYPMWGVEEVRQSSRARLGKVQARSWLPSELSLIMWRKVCCGELLYRLE
jgi:hypothetical protein